MTEEKPGLFGRIGLGNPLRRWTRALQRPTDVPSGDLWAMTAQMASARAEMDRLAASAYSELLARTGGPDGIKRPDQCDWAERPGPWTAQIRPRGQVDPASPTDLGGGVKLFHDAAQADLSIRQEPVTGNTPGPRFGLVLEVYRFDGSFLSLVQDLPDAALRGLTLDHFIEVHLSLDREQPVEVYARLNVQHGPNVDQMVRQFDIQGESGKAEFDLAYSKINERRLEKAWLDLIFEGPEMNRIGLRDMVILRAPRADI